MKVVAVTQARISSSRLPQKVLLPLGSVTVLGLHLKRAGKSKLINEIIVATTNEIGVEKIIAEAKSHNCSVFQGSLDDVLDRFYQSVAKDKPEYVVRLTSDCPLIDPELIDDTIKKFIHSQLDYGANCLNNTLPDGMDVEVFKFAALETAWKEAKLKSEREHVTPYIRNSGKFEVLAVDYTPNLGSYRLTLDTVEDYILIKKLVEEVGEDQPMEAYLNYLRKNPELLKINSQYERNEGYQKSLKGDSEC